MQQVFESEARNSYTDALKKGRSEYRSLTSKGEAGTLLVLDEIVQQNRIMGYVNRPTRELMLFDIVGTYTSGRAYSFSASFYPLHSEGSEFATKWVALYKAHITEGLRDPIEVYEYLWNYYVVEGNKRVSVLKYSGADTVMAKITRIIPQFNDDDPLQELYYAFMQYDRHGFFQGLRLSSSEKYSQLEQLEQEELAENPKLKEVKWPSVYIRFYVACRRAGIVKDVGDALFEYIKLYGFPHEELLDVLATRLSALKPQLSLVESMDEPTLVLEAGEEELGLIQRLFISRKSARVVFAYEQGKTAENWIGAHDRGRVEMEEALGDRVSTLVINDLTPDNCYQRLTQEAMDGDLVLVTSGALVTGALRFALENPEITLLVCSRVHMDARLHTYYGRYYETTFLCGVVAGLATKENHIAYVTPQVTGRSTSDINAFAIGVKSVNPKAKVVLAQKRVGPEDEAGFQQAVQKAAQEGVDIVMTPLYPAAQIEGIPKDIFSAVLRVNRQGEAQEFLAAPAWNWGRFYTEIVRSYLNRSLEILGAASDSETGVTGLWWGIGTGVLRLWCGKSLGISADNLVRYLRSSIALGRFNPFHGPLSDRDGVERVPSYTNPRPYEIMDMSWLIDIIDEGFEVSTED